MSPFAIEQETGVSNACHRGSHGRSYVRWQTSRNFMHAKQSGCWNDPLESPEKTQTPLKEFSSLRSFWPCFC
jgi:hypothetical protein